ncbi:MAG: protein phosphatase 2C domain-containing protein [Limnohabitans sp.]|nr:protein phosphatase 2C domain-containing protein [Limnohabitans sp.]
MKIYSAIQIGEYHQNHCEDHIFIGEYGKSKKIFAVMDGCTTAIDSHFASTLVAKILKKICFEKGYTDFLIPNSSNSSIEEHLQDILKELLKELKSIKNQLLLDSKELLSTLIIMLCDTATQQGMILVIGDGLVVINGVKHSFEQNNTPDYIGYHLDKDFEIFYNSQKQKLFFDSIIDISIVTDGIFSFQDIEKKGIDESTLIEYFTIDKTFEEKNEMLYLKLKSVENTYGIKPTDDFAIIRVVESSL